MEEEMLIPEMPKETINDRIFGLEAEKKQMLAMIEENIRLIAEGDDVEGRTYLKAHLERSVKNIDEELNRLNGIDYERDANELQALLDESYELLYGGQE